MAGIQMRNGRVGRRIAAALGLLAALELAPRAADAAPIRRGLHAHPAARTDQAWSRYLWAGPSAWSRTRAPEFTIAVRRMIWRTLRSGDPAASPMINYLAWRRSLRPGRFDFYHPRLGPALAQLSVPPAPPSIPQSLAPTVVPPTPDPVPPPRSSPQTADPVVPEPSTLAAALTLTAWGLWSRRRLRKRLAGAADSPSA